MKCSIGKKDWELERRRTGDKEDNLLVPRIGLMCIFFLRKRSHCIRAGKGVEKAGQLFRWNTKQLLLIEDQPVSGGVLPVNKEQAAMEEEEEEEGEDGAAASPPPEQHGHPHSLHHHLNLRRFHHPCKTGHTFRATFTFAVLKDAQCRKAGRRLTLEVRVRARVRRAPDQSLLLSSATTATEVSPSW